MASRPTFRRPLAACLAAGVSVAAFTVLTLAPTPPASAVPIVAASDGFTRTVTHGWGAAEVGGPYSIPNPTGMSVAGGAGLMALTAAASRQAVLTTGPLSDSVTVNSFGLSAVPSAGSVYAAQMLRVQPDGSYLAARVRIMADKTVRIGARLVDPTGNAATINDDAVAAVKASTVPLMVKTVLTGTHMSMTVWAKGTAEPAAPQYQATVPATAGPVGVWAYLGSGTPATTIKIDDLSDTDLIGPNASPIASIGALDPANLSATFDASGSYDPDGSIVSYAWDFGDGTSSSAARTEHTYTDPGTYSVTLTVTDDRHGTASTATTVTVVRPNQPPTAVIDQADSNGLDAHFSAAGSTDPDGSIVSYAWTFGDGDTATTSAPHHTYISPGNYPVTVTVTDDRGATASATTTVTVSRPAQVAPNQATTGVPAGTSLTVVNSDVTVTTPGAVLDSLDIHGIVTIKAPDVTIRRSIIRGSATPTRQVGLINAFTPGAGNYLVEDTTLAPTTESPNFDGMKLSQPGTINRVNISGTVDGISIFGSGITVSRSYIHDLHHFLVDPNQGGTPSHDDGIQIQSGVGNSITQNTIDGGYNSAIMITQDAGPTSDLSITHNWIDGGGCSLNYKTDGAYKTGMHADDNTFGHNQRLSGCAIIHNSAASDLVPTGNVWTDGTPVLAKKGA